MAQDIAVREASVRTPEACALAGITYRQADYWARAGLLRPSLADAQGSGSQRRYTLRDVQTMWVLAVMPSTAGADGRRVHSLQAVLAALPEWSGFLVVTASGEALVVNDEVDCMFHITSAGPSAVTILNLTACPVVSLGRGSP